MTETPPTPVPPAETAPPASPASAAPPVVEEPASTESRLFGVSVPGWATLLTVGTLCLISLVEGLAVVLWSIARGLPLDEVKIPDALYQLATMALGFYLGRKAARR